MTYSLDVYGGKYTPQWVMKNLHKGQIQSRGKRQWLVCGFSFGSVEDNDKDLEKYAVTRIVEALNKENNFGECLALREYWKGGQVKDRMNQEIKEGTYSLSRRMRYTSSKKFTGFYDENDPTFTIGIPAEKCEIITKYVRYGVPLEDIYNGLGLRCSYEEMCEYVRLNRDGTLDEALKFIAHKSRSDEGFIDYVRNDVPILRELHLNDLKIQNEE